MTPDAERTRELHAQAHESRRAHIMAMSPIERMEEAYRLFRLVRDAEDEAAPQG